MIKYSVLARIGSDADKEYEFNSEVAEKLLVELWGLMRSSTLQYMVSDLKEVLECGGRMSR